MNIKEYISSGIVESYVLGLASAEERAEFEELCLKNPELVAARNEFEMVLEKNLVDKETTLTGEAREDLMSTIRPHFSSKPNKTIIMENNSKNGSSTMRLLTIVSVLLLLGAAYFAYDFYSKNQKLEGASKDLQAKLDKLVEDQKAITAPNVAVVNLVGTTPAKASANIYWDTLSKADDNVFLVVKNMPKLANDKQYQLWAIINGQDGGLQPTSLGLFDVGEDGKVMLKMKGTQNADAFAITIETKGNTGGPNLEQLQTMGKTRL